MTNITRVDFRTKEVKPDPDKLSEWYGEDQLKPHEVPEGDSCLDAINRCYEHIQHLNVAVGRLRAALQQAEHIVLHERDEKQRLLRLEAHILDACERLSKGKAT